jgi:hypothetical protein
VLRSRISVDESRRMVYGGSWPVATDATLWENKVHILDISGVVGAELCGVSLHGGVKVLNNYVVLNSEPLEFPRAGTRAAELLDTINSKRSACEDLVDEVNELRRKANDYAYDAQTGIDFLKRYGKKVTRSGVEEVVVEELIEQAGAPAEFADVPTSFGQTQCREILQNYEDVVYEYLGKVEELHSTLEQLADIYASADKEVGDVGAISFARIFPESDEPGQTGEHKRIFGIDQSYPIGPFQIGMEVTASASYSLAIAAGVDWQAKAVGAYQLGTNPNASMGIDMHARGTGQVVPHFAADVQLALYAGIGNKFAGVEAGVRAKLVLADLAFPLQAYGEIGSTIGAKVEPLSRFYGPEVDAKWNYKWGLGATAVIKALDGAVDLFVRARLLFLTKSWSKNLATWNGIKRKFTLLALEKSVDPTSLGEPLTNEDELSATIAAPSFARLSCEDLGALEENIWTPTWTPDGIKRGNQELNQEAIWSSALATSKAKARAIVQDSPLGGHPDSRCYREALPLE